MKSALVPNMRERAGGVATPQQPVTICVALSPWGEKCGPNTGEQGEVVCKDSP